jgi:phenylacetate-CoA ligase
MISPVHTWVAEKTGIKNDLNPATLRKWQIEKLKSLIEYASHKSKFYRDHLNKNYDHLTDLPFTLPSDIVREPLAFLAVPQKNVERIATLKNSGTTLSQKRIFFTKKDLDRTIDFFSVGMSGMVTEGERVQILISSDTRYSLGNLLKESLSRIGVTAKISNEISSVIKAIEASQNADCIVGMPSEMLYLSCIEPGLRPKSILLAGDHVPQSVINRLKETWKCDVFTHYGHTEFGYGCAVDCAFHDGFHLRDADLIFEIIDPMNSKPVKSGESGEIVITTLNNEAMPLIRYRTGNIASITDAHCKCGGSLFRLKNMKGRYRNDILLKNGSVLNINQIDERIYAVPSIRAYHAVLNNEVLELTIDSTEQINIGSLSSMLPAVKLKIIRGNADPFRCREKRSIYLMQ